VRRLLALVRGLPQESGTVRYLEPSAAWDTSEYLLALIAELLDMANRMYLKAHDASPGKPLMIPRPGVVVEVPQKRMATFEETLAFFARR